MRGGCDVEGALVASCRAIHPMTGAAFGHLEDGGLSQETTWQALAELGESSTDPPWQAIFGGLEAGPEGLRAREDTAVRAVFAPPGWRAFRTTVDFTSESGRGFFIEVGEYVFQVGLTMNAVVSLDPKPEPAARIDLAQWPVVVRGGAQVGTGRRELVVERARGRVRIEMDGETLVEGEDPRPMSGSHDVSLHLPGGITIHTARVEAASPVGEPRPVAPVKDYDLYVCIDFNDDVIKNPWTERTFREWTDLCRRRDIQRIYFIYHYGYHSGFWTRPPNKLYPQFAENARRTYEAVGEFMPAAIRAAHDAGMPFYAVFKPYETALYTTLPEGSEGARRYGRIPRLGGPICWSPDFLTERPQLRAERATRDPLPDLDEHPIREIVFTPETPDGAREVLPRIRLWVSEDNGRYYPYDAPFGRRLESDGRVVLDGLDIRQRFVAVTVEGDPTYKFGNILRRFVQVRDDRGEALPLTFGNQSRDRGGNFQDVGFLMDTPARNAVGAMDDMLWLDGEEPFGFGVGRIHYLQGILCEAYPEVRELWLGEVDKIIAAGADGIDFRIANHNRTFDWDAFGFNEPIVRAFQEEHGVDLRREPFDREAWRRLRGSFYDAFFREAAQRLRRAGMGVQLHVNKRMGSPDWHIDAEVHFDWPAWLRDGLVDEVTIKMPFVTMGLGAEVALAARDAGARVNLCPYLNGLPRTDRGPRLAEFMLDETLRGGADGFIMYENAAFLAAREDGGLEVSCPYLLDTFSRHARPVSR